MEKIERHVNQAIRNTRDLAAGMRSVQAVSEGLQSALHDLASRVEEQCNVECVFLCEQPVHVRSGAVATHLYRIVREAVYNAVREGRVDAVVDQSPLELGKTGIESALKALKGEALPEIIFTPARLVTPETLNRPFK